MADKKNRILDTTAKKALAAAIATPAALFGAVTAVNHLAYRRSNIAAASEVYNRVTGNKKKMADAVEWDNFILDRSEANEQRQTLPTLLSFKVSVEDTDFDGMQTLVLNRRSINDRAVIYVHGRVLVDQPSIYQWKFLDTIARRTRAEVIAPIYPLAPVHGFREAYDKIEALYLETVKKYGAQNVTLMGDSAGAGIAAGLCQSFSPKGIEQPGHLILISPWVDLTLGNPDIAHYEAQDPMLSASGMRKVGKVWADGTDPRDPRLSPINGPVSDLRNVMVFTGTREILHPDAVLFHQRVSAYGNHSELFVGTGLHNNFPLYPIPEASGTINSIVTAITMD